MRGGDIKGRERRRADRERDFIAYWLQAIKCEVREKGREKIYKI